MDFMRERARGRLGHASLAQKRTPFWRHGPKVQASPSYPVTRSKKLQGRSLAFLYSSWAAMRRARMHTHMGRTWGWSLTVALYGASGLCFATGANLSGTGRALSLPAGANREVVVATFNDTLATRNARVVDAMFEDLLGRPSDAGSLAMF